MAHVGRSRLHYYDGLCQHMTWTPETSDSLEGGEEEGRGGGGEGEEEGQNHFPVVGKGKERKKHQVELPSNMLEPFSHQKVDSKNNAETQENAAQKVVPLTSMTVTDRRKRGPICLYGFFVCMGGGPTQR